jgi:hypothetical protein|nr:MAG TPA: hypothetical protein [Caudoviricetes sp.]
MSNEVVKVQIANRLLDEYGKDIQSQCIGGCVSHCDANKTIFAIRQSARKLKAMTRDEFAKLGNWDYISEAYGAYEAVMEALLLAVKYEMDKMAGAI